MPRFLTISGSLRRDSTNSRLLRVAARVAPPTAVLVPFEGLDGLPHFNPDLDVDPAPAPVLAFRAQVAESDALVISSPEYAHGVPGSLKNALDWLVSGPEMIGKPVAVINASFRATHAHAALVETLTTMAARVIEESSTTVALDSLKHFSEDELLTRPEVAEPLRLALERLAGAC